MRKIVSNFFMSLDGVVEAPDQWHMRVLDLTYAPAAG